MSKLPKISVLIAVDDHPAGPDEAFCALVSQTLASDEYEVIMIDSSLTHDYTTIYQKYLRIKDAGLRFVYKTIERGGRASAYNFGIRMCRAPIILFIADDNIVKKETVEIHLKYHINDNSINVVGVGSAIIPEKFRTTFSSWLEESGELFGVPFSQDMQEVPENFFYIGNTSIKREFLDSAGVFDEAFPYHGWDDFELGQRLIEKGMKSEYLPAAATVHMHDISLKERSQMMVEAGESAAIFERKYPGDHPWQEKCRIPRWRYKLNRITALLGYCLTAQRKFMHSFYQAHLSLHFMDGYRRARHETIPD